MAFALTRTRSSESEKTLENTLRDIFEPIIRPNMKQSWEKSWKNWFVTTEKVEDQKFPGKVHNRHFSKYKSLTFS